MPKSIRQASSISSISAATFSWNKPSKAKSPLLVVSSHYRLKTKASSVSMFCAILHDVGNNHVQAGPDQPRLAGPARDFSELSESGDPDRPQIGTGPDLESSGSGTWDPCT